MSSTRAALRVLTLLATVQCSCAFDLPGARRIKRRASLTADASISSWSKEGFNNVRTPAALISGTSFVAVNTAPLPLTTDAFLVGVAKRIYLVVGVGTFASTLIAVLVATVALEKLAAGVANQEVEEEYFEFDYVAMQTHFFGGVLGACLLIGLRAWIAFTCPRFGNIALGMMGSSFLLMLHFLPRSLAAIPARYLSLLLARVSWSSPVLLLAIAVGAWTLALSGREFYIGLFLDKSCPKWNMRPGAP